VLINDGIIGPFAGERDRAGYGPFEEGVAEDGVNEVGVIQG